MGAFDDLVNARLQGATSPDQALALWADDPRGRLGVVGCAAIVASSFGQLIEWLEHNTELLSQRLGLAVAVERGRMVVGIKVHGGAGDAAWLEAAFSALLMRLLRALSHEHARATFASFTGAAPENAESYTLLLGCAPSFQARTCELVIDGDAAWMPNRTADPAFFEHVAGYARLALARQRSRSQVGALVLSLLCREPSLVLLNMEEAGEHLGMSARTLRRRLSSEGSSFADLTRQALIYHARVLLSDPAVSVKEAAYRMGYSDPSALHRAIRRAAGRPPSALRASGSAH